MNKKKNGKQKKKNKKKNEFDEKRRMRTITKNFCSPRVSNEY